MRKRSNELKTQKYETDENALAVAANKTTTS